MDALAVSMIKGLSLKKDLFKQALLIALFFGGFQWFMPLLGYALGTFIHFPLFLNYAHWIAFALLGAIGAKMIRESFHIKEEEHEEKMVSTKLIVLLGLAIATSIDSLAVGLSFSFLSTKIFLSAILIGITTFSISFAGVYIGKRAGDFLANRAELLGGLILIGIGIKIVLEHGG